MRLTCRHPSQGSEGMACTNTYIPTPIHIHTHTHIHIYPYKQVGVQDARGGAALRAHRQGLKSRAVRKSTVPTQPINFGCVEYHSLVVGWLIDCTHLHIHTHTLLHAQRPRRGDGGWKQRHEPGGGGGAAGPGDCRCQHDGEWCVFWGVEFGDVMSGLCACMNDSP